jgi:preprotein translocase SecE subunit
MFAIYKRGQGRYTRLYSGFGMALIAGFGCWQLYRKLEANDLNFWIQTMIPTILFLGLGGLAFWLVNKASVADFMISAEGELKKVNWSSRHEIAVSTFVVILVSVLLSVILGATDFIFQLFFEILLR